MSKEVTCIVCGETVSKRKSLAFRFDGVEGRACRHHQELVDFCNKQKQDDIMRKFDEKMSLIGTVSLIRVWHTIRGVPLSILLHRIRDNKGQEFYLKVREEIDKQGAKMTAGEVFSAMAAYGNIIASKVKAKL